MPARSLPVLSRRRVGAWLAAFAAPVCAHAADTGFGSNFAGTMLRDQRAKAFSFQPLLGKVLLVNFVYTGCGTVCPVQTRALVEVMQALPAAQRARVHFVSVSLDPLQDTPQALMQFATRMGADLTHWSFVTGSHADVGRVSERLRLFKPSGKRPDDHATGLWLVDAQGRLLLRLSGAPVDTRRVAAELQALLSLPAAAKRAG